MQKFSLVKKMQIKDPRLGGGEALLWKKKIKKVTKNSDHVLRQH